MLSLDGIIFSLQKTGGISVYFSELCKRIVKYGFDSELSLFEDKMPLSLLNCSDTTNKCTSRFAERYRRCVVSNNTELFHSSYYRLPQFIKIPSIISVYDFTYEHFGSGISRWVHSSQKFTAIREASSVICISENTRKDLFELMPDIAKDKVQVIPLGVSDSFFPLQAQPYLNCQRPYVLFVGSRVYYKNFQSAVDAVTLLSDVELVCVGGGEFSESETLLLEKSIQGRYRHEGMVNEERLNYLYNCAICLLYPSSYEGFGIPVLESMRAGCPVIALSSSSIPEVAGNAAILLDTAEPDLLAKAIELVADRNYRMQIRKKGFLQASRFSWDRTFEQTIQVYEEVLGYSLSRNIV